MMKSYKSITTRYMKVQKKRTLLTMFGIVMSIALISGIGTIVYSYMDARIHVAKVEKGNYETQFKSISNKEVNVLKNHTEIKDLSLVQNIGFAKIYDTPEDEKKDSKPNFKYIYLKAYDEKSLNETFTINIIEGRLSNNSNEIILEQGALKYLSKDLNLGDKVVLPFGDRKVSDANHNNIPSSKGGFSTTELFEEKYKKEYTLVGIIKSTSFSTNHFMYDAITSLDNLNDSENNYSAYMNIKSNKNKRDVGNKIAYSLGINLNKDKEGDSDDSSPSINFNNQLLNLYGESQNVLKNDALSNISAFVIILIVVCTVALICNAFNISVLERISQFGILRSIGSTPRQIRNIIFKEAFLISIVSIPLGFLSGILAIKIVIAALGGNLLYMESFNISIKWQVFLLSTVLGFITVFLSALFPSLMAGRISPLDAVRNSNDIKKGKLKNKKNNKLVSLIFKVEGSLAYKNIMRNKKRFIITVFSLIISIVMFITFNSLTSLAKSSNLRDSSPYYNATVHSENGFTNEEYEEIKNLDGVEAIYKTNTTYSEIALEKSRINSYFLDKYNFEDLHKGFILSGTRIRTYDEETLELLKENLIKGHIDIKSLDDFGIIIVNKNVDQGTKNQLVMRDFSNYKIGEEMKLPKVDYSNSKKTINNPLESTKDAIYKDNFYFLKIVGMLDSDPLAGDYLFNRGLTIIMSEKVYKQIVGDLDSSNLMLKLSSNQNEREKVQDFFQQKSLTKDIYFNDIQAMVEKDNKIEFQINVLVYGFITVITLISAVNIINTISTNLLLRKREFATLRAIGMGQNQVIKLVLLEGTFHGILASIFGSIIGASLSFLLYNISSPLVDIKRVIPWNSIIIASLGSILITFIASLWPLKKIKSQNIVESIRIEE